MDICITFFERRFTGIAV